MKNLSTILIFTILLLAGCNNSDNSNSLSDEIRETKNESKTKVQLLADSILTSKQDSLNKIEEAKENEKQRLASKFAEKDFFSNLKEIDRDFGENNFSKFTKILNRHKTSVYILYLELSEIKRQAYLKAKTCCTEIRSNGVERTLHNYFDVLKKEIEYGENNFMIKYNLDNRLLQCFKNNYSSCYGDNSEKYCFDKKSILPNAEFWNK